MAPDNLDTPLEGNSVSAESLIAIDPKVFFLYAFPLEKRWQDLIGLGIHHCKWGDGTIRKVEGSYLYVDLPARPDKKSLTEFGLDSFRFGFFHDLLISEALQQKIIASLEAPSEPQPDPLTLVPKEGSKTAPKKPRRPKAAKKTA